METRSQKMETGILNIWKMELGICKIEPGDQKMDPGSGMEGRMRTRILGGSGANLDLDIYTSVDLSIKLTDQYVESIATWQGSFILIGNTIKQHDRVT